MKQFTAVEIPSNDDIVCEWILEVENLVFKTAGIKVGITSSTEKNVDIRNITHYAFANYGTISWCSGNREYGNKRIY